MTSNGCWHRFAVFWLLSLALLSLVPLLSFAFGTSMDFGAIAERASVATGIPWTSSLFDLLRLCRAEPGLWLLLLGSFVPTLAALLVLARRRDASQWRSFARRFRPVAEGRASLAHASVYAVLWGGMIVGLLVVFELRELILPGRYQQASFSSIQTLLTSLLFAALLDQGALLEEGGWRGYATPLLQDNGVVPLVGAIAVGLAWSSWHIPRDIVVGLPATLGVATYLFLYLPAFTLGTVTTSIIAVYFANRLGGSIIPAIIVHGLGNDAVGISGLAAIERALTPSHQVTKALPFALLSVLILLVSGSRLALPDASEPNGDSSVVR